MASILAEGFTAHHRLLDRNFQVAYAAVQGRAWSQAVLAFQVFWDAIEKHMATEELVLFPAYEKEYGENNALTGLLRKGHKDLRAFFEEIAEAIAAHDDEEAAALMDTVAQILAHHDDKEEQELYEAAAPLILKPKKIIALLST